jgi:hypothetical protein
VVLGIERLQSHPGAGAISTELALLRNLATRAGDTADRLLNILRGDVAPTT